MTYNFHRRPVIILFSLFFLLLLSGCSSQGATIQWETASEVNTAGFNLYRSDNPEGPWEKINQQLIPPSQDPVSGGRYEFVDENAQPGKVYYYQLEEVELSGNVTRFDPIKLETSARVTAWPWWVAGAFLAIGVGWLLGSIFGRQKSHESDA